MSSSDHTAPESAPGATGANAESAAQATPATAATTPVAAEPELAFPEDFTNVRPAATEPAAAEPEAVEPDTTDPDVDQAATQSATAPAVRYGVGPFSIREIVIFGASAVLLIATFLPQFYVHLFSFQATIWANLWMGIGIVALPGLLPALLASGLIVLRRLVPGRSWRVGALSVDQFASAMAIVSVVFYLLVWAGIGTTNARFAVELFGGNIAVQLTFGFLISFFAALIFMAATTFGPYIPFFADDFRGRAEIDAPPIARDAVTVARRPRPVRPEPAPVPTAYAAPATTTTTATTPSAPATVPAATPAPAPAPTSPFWVHSTYQRSVVDRTSGALLFEIGPSAWALAVEDLGTALVIRHEDGRVGILREINGLSRG